MKFSRIFLKDSLLASCIDDETRLYHLRITITRDHLRNHDYSRSIRDALKEDALTDEIARIESEDADSAERSREKIFSAIERRYPAPS
jgi:hypothetical protein